MSEMPMNKLERQKRLREITNGVEAVAIDCIQNNRQPEKWVKDVGWLLHEFETQSADVERLVEALRKYGRHLPTCKFREWECSHPGCGETHCYACTCGWDIVLFNQPVAPKETK